MRQSFASAAAGLVLCFFVGCGGEGGGPAKAESLMKSSVGLMNEVATVFETAKNADEAKPKLEALGKRFQDLKKQADAIKLPKATEDSFKSKYEPEMKKAIERMTSATMKFAMSNLADMKKLEDVMKSFGK